MDFRESNMPIKNTPSSYGSVSKFFHWIIVLLVLIQVYLVLQAKVLPENSPLAGFLIGSLHKPIGMLTLFIAILGYSWHFISIRPLFPSRMGNWEKVAAQLVHNLLYLLLIIMPISGLLMSTADGYPPNFFGLYQVPQFMEKNKMLADYFFNLHRNTAIILVSLIIIHTLAALKHHFIDKDSVLTRMLPFCKTSSERVENDTRKKDYPSR